MPLLCPKIYVMNLKIYLLFLFSFLFAVNVLADDITYQIDPASSSNSADGSIELTVTGGEAPYTYSWTSPTYSNFFSTYKNIYNLNPGEYCFTVKTSQNCTASKCIIVQDCSVSCLGADFDFEYGYNGCDIDFYELSYGDAVSYEWTFGDGYTSEETDPNHTYFESGTYLVTLTVTDDAGNSNSVQKNVITLCGSGGDLGDACFLSGPNMVPASSPFVLSVAAPGGVPPFTYEWDVPIGVIENNYINPSGPGPHTFQFKPSVMNGQNYSFLLKITDSQGNVFTCYHPMTISGNAPDIDLAIFGIDDGADGFLANNYMVFVAFMDYWTMGTGYECKFDFIDPNGMFLTSSGWLLGTYQYEDITFANNGVHQAILSVKSGGSIYTIVEDFMVTGGAIIPVFPPTPDFEIIPDPSEVIPVGVCEGVNPGLFSNIPLPAVVNTFSNTPWIYRIDWYVEQGSAFKRIPSGPEDELPNDGGGIWNGGEFPNGGASIIPESLLKEVGECINIKIGICQYYEADPFPAPCKEQQLEFWPATQQALDDFGYLYTHEEECKLIVVGTQVEVTDIIVESGSNNCAPYLSVEAGCGETSSQTTLTPEGPCAGDVQEYLEYKWKAFDINDPTKEIEDFFVPPSDMLNLNTRQCVEINSESTYFDDFTGNEVQVRIQAVVKDYMESKDELTKIVTVTKPMRITIDEEQSRCAGVNSMMSLGPVVEGGSGQYTFTWSGADVNDLSSTTSPNPVLKYAINSTNGTRSYSLFVVDDVTSCELEFDIAINVSTLTMELQEPPEIGCSSNSLVQMGPISTNYGGSGSYSYYWSAEANGQPFGLDYMDNPSIPNPNVQPHAPGGDLSVPVTYTLTVVDQFGGCEVSDAVDVFEGTFFPGNNFEFLGSDLTVCHGSPLTIGEGAEIVFGNFNEDFEWTSNNPNFQGGNTSILDLRYITNFPGIYTYTCTAFFFGGCSATDEMTITVLKPWIIEGFESELNYGGNDAWSSATNVIKQSGDENLDSYNVNSGAIGPFDFSWISEDPASYPEPFSWTESDEGYPNEANLSFSPNNLFSLEIEDLGTGCKNTILTNKVVHYNLATMSTQIAGIIPGRDCENPLSPDYCFNVILDLGTAVGTFLPQNITFNQFICPPGSGVIGVGGCIQIEDIQLNLISNEGIYSGTYCISFLEAGVHPLTLNDDRSTYILTLPNESFHIAKYEFDIPLNEVSPDDCYIGSNIHDDLVRAGNVYVGPNNPYNCNYTGGNPNFAFVRTSTIIAKEKIVITAGTTIIGGEFNVSNYFRSHLYIDPCFLVESDLLLEDTPPIDALVTKPVEEILITQTIKESVENTEDKKYSNDLKVYPNPINGNSNLNIDYTIESEEPELVTLSLISPLGQRLKVVFEDRPHSEGKFSSVISTTNLPSGILFVELKIGNFKLVRKVVNIKIN